MLDDRMYELPSWIASLMQADPDRAQKCGHIDTIHTTTPTSNGCEACLESGDTWVHLRACLSCGTVGCCEDSKNQHAKKHAQSSNHPLVMSIEPGEQWFYCYPDDLLFI